jgi:hypothetical protein
MKISVTLGAVLICQPVVILLQSATPADPDVGPHTERTNGMVVSLGP